MWQTEQFIRCLFSLTARRSLEENPTSFLLAVKIIATYQVIKWPLAPFFLPLPCTGPNSNVLKEI